jgi:hypothetical protein
MPTRIDNFLKQKCAFFLSFCDTQQVKKKLAPNQEELATTLPSPPPTPIPPLLHPHLGKKPHVQIG